MDFSRKTGADLALLEAKAGKPKKRRRSDGARDAAPASSSSGGSSSRKGRKKRRRSRNGDGSESDEEEEDSDDDEDVGLSDNSGGYGEVEIVDEFGRHRTVTRGGREHREHLQAKKRAAEIKAEQEEEEESRRQSATGGGSTSFDERYSYRGNRGAPPPPPPPPFSGSGSSSSSSAAAAQAGGWAWSSGAGRGADGGDFETREGQERRAKKGMAELLEREGARGDAGRGDGGAKASFVLCF